jgi:hypothetical protein
MEYDDATMPEQLFDRAKLLVAAREAGFALGALHCAAPLRGKPIHPDDEAAAFWILLATDIDVTPLPTGPVARSTLRRSRVQWLHDVDALRIDTSSKQQRGSRRVASRFGRLNVADLLVGRV